MQSSPTPRQQRKPSVRRQSCQSVSSGQCQQQSSPQQTNQQLSPQQDDPFARMLLSLRGAAGGGGGQVVPSRKKSKTQQVTKLGQGTYGKVFRPPPITCRFSGKEYVGKISKSRETKPQQYQKFQMIRRDIDPHNRFTVPYHGHVKKHPQNACNPVWVDSDFDIQFVFDYGGVSLDKMRFESVLTNSDSRRQTFASFRPLVLGLKQMAKKEKAHLDLKSPNIVFNPEKNMMKLIDFDLLMDFDEIEYEMLQRFSNIIYYVWPPEINFFVTNMGTIYPSVKNIDSLQYLKRILGTDRSKRYFQKLQAYVDDGEGEIIPEKIDLYALGLVWSEIFRDSDPRISALIERMIEPNPELRINPDQLVVEYEEVLRSL